jgi:hypothetical protein
VLRIGAGPPLTFIAWQFSGQRGAADQGRLSFRFIDYRIQPIFEIFFKKCNSKKVKVTMKAHAAVVSIALSFAFSGLMAAATTRVSPSTGNRKLVDSSAEISTATPQVLSVTSSTASLHRFPVMDEKGLLLTCIAPELEKDKETDVFKDCSLAPGRTLDDVMHSFVQGIHEEQRLRMKEHSDPQNDAVENADGKTAQK